MQSGIQPTIKIRPLSEATRVVHEKILNPESLTNQGGITSDAPVLVILVAGKGTRFGQEPKCIQRVHGIPLAVLSPTLFREAVTMNSGNINWIYWPNLCSA